MRAALSWAGLWHSENKMDGVTEHFLYFDGIIALFPTRRKAREFIQREYGFIKTRRDLRTEPHGWRLPKAIRVSVAKVKEGK
jgi:hypothetical protein